MIENIIIAHLFKPSSAATNRILAYAKSYYQLGKKVFLVLGCEKHEPLPILNGVEVYKVVSETHNGLHHKMAITINRLYIHGSSVIQIYGSPILCLFLPQTRYNIFYECTEVPFYGRMKSIRNRIKEGIKIFLAKRATGMLVISNALRQYFNEKGIKKIAVINMFVDAERFNVGCNTDVDNKYIAYCGTISPFKDGVDCLIKAFNIFLKSYSDYILKLIGGFENEDAKMYLQSLVNELDLADFVEFTGKVKPNDMPKLLCGASVLALARPNNEQAKYGFPTKLGEYLATGKPVVVTNVGEIGDFLTDGVNCRMAKPDDSVDFADKMIWVANHYEEALALGKAGKQLTNKAFSSIEQSKRALVFMESVVK